MKTTRAVALLMKLESAGRVRLSLTGMLRGQTRLPVWKSPWPRPELRRVALSADSSASWAWAKMPADALADVSGGCEAPFVVRGGDRGRR